MDYTGKKLIFMGKPDDFSEEGLDLFANEFVAALKESGVPFAEEQMAMPRASRPAKTAAKRPKRR